MLNTDPSGAEGQEEPKGKGGFLRNRLRQAVSPDSFGQPSRVVRAIATVLWILVFFGAWKLLDSWFVLHWAFSAVFAAVSASIVLRILKRVLAGDEPQEE